MLTKEILSTDYCQHFMIKTEFPWVYQMQRGVRVRWSEFCDSLLPHPLGVSGGASRIPLAQRRKRSYWTSVHNKYMFCFWINYFGWFIMLLLDIIPKRYTTFFNKLKPLTSMLQRTVSSIAFIQQSLMRPTLNNQLEWPSWTLFQSRVM